MPKRSQNFDSCPRVAMLFYILNTWIFTARCRDGALSVLSRFLFEKRTALSTLSVKPINASEREWISFQIARLVKLQFLIRKPHF